jgi:hypothetical protein
VRHGTTASTEEQEEEAVLTAVMQADELSCPISFQLMTDPVVAEDGHTYQRQAIEEWIKKCITGEFRYLHAESHLQSCRLFTEPTVEWKTTFWRNNGR